MQEIISEAPQVLHGKWSNPGIPHRGWECVGFDDLGTFGAGVCQMCEHQEIWYVHHMRHPDYPEAISAGAVCAGNMSGDYITPKRRERDAKNLASRRGAWLKRKWKTSYRGNSYLRTDNFVITIFESPWGLGVSVIDKYCEPEVKTFLPTHFTREVDAKLAVFDCMVGMKAQRKHPLTKTLPSNSTYKEYEL
jgi:hypothetical protein